MRGFKSAINCLLGVLLIILGSKGLFAQESISIGQWRTHLPYGRASRIAFSENEVITIGAGNLFGIGLANGNITRYDRVWGVSDVNASGILYHEPTKLWLAWYSNANIDIWSDRKITNVNSILRSTLVGDKTIYDAHIDGDEILLATGFGITVFNIRRMEFSGTFFISNTGTPVQTISITSDSTYFYAVTAQGLKRAPKRGANLADFQVWETLSGVNGLPSDTILQVVAVNDQIFTLLKNQQLYRLRPFGWELQPSDNQFQINRLKVVDQSLLFLEEANDGSGIGRIRVSDMNGNITFLPFPTASLRSPQDVVRSAPNEWYVADRIFGLVRLKNGILDQLIPNGPFSANVSKMAYGNGNVWVASGGVNSLFETTFSVNGFYRFREGAWNSWNVFNEPAITEALSIYAVTSHPDGRTFFGSFYGGLVERQNDGSIQIYDQFNSILQGAVGNELRTNISGLAVDNNQNLWISNYGAERPIAVLKKDGNWQNFRPSVSTTGNTLTDIVIDDFDQKWILLSRANNDGILVMNHGNSIENTTDDVYRILRTGQGAGNLPSNEVLSIAKDQSGFVWIGTTAGVAVFFCPGSVLTNQGCDAQQIFVTQDGFGAFLLEAERVQAIKVDGANRKWMGTTNGVWLFSPDGTQQIANFNTTNSPLLSNNILAIEIDELTGEVFFATDQGIISYRGTATLGGSEHENTVLAFPNPVQPTYQGPIAVRGLPANAEVRITDVSGRVVFRGFADGGQAIWDGKVNNGERARAGVYLVFSNSLDGESRHVAKILLLQ